MTEPFSHEDRVKAGTAVLDLLDALEDADLQEAFTDTARGLDRIVRLQRDRGLADRVILLGIVGFLLGPILPPETEDE